MEQDSIHSCILMNAEYFLQPLLWSQFLRFVTFAVGTFRSGSVSRKSFRKCGPPVTLPRPIKGPLCTMTLQPRGLSENHAFVLSTYSLSTM